MKRERKKRFLEDRTHLVVDQFTDSGKKTDTIVLPKPKEGYRRVVEESEKPPTFYSGGRILVGLAASMVVGIAIGWAARGDSLKPAEVDMNPNQPGIQQPHEQFNGWRPPQ